MDDFDNNVFRTKDGDPRSIDPLRALPKKSGKTIVKYFERKGRVTRMAPDVNIAFELTTHDYVYASFA